MEEQEDRISLLPDCLVGTIVSILQPKAAARTMVLSHRWRHIWPSLPLDLNLETDSDARFLGATDSDARFLGAKSILSILSSHCGPIRRFCVTTLAGVGTCTWLQTLAERRIDDTLVLRFASGMQHHPLPRSLLSSAGVAIRHLDLHCCRLGLPNNPYSPVQTLQHVEYLSLSDVIISEMALHRMIEVCPVLSELHLSMIDGLHRICFHSCTLTTMSISRPYVPLSEFSVSGTPAIKSIIFSYVNLWRIPTFIINVGNGRYPKLGLKLPNIDSPSLDTFSSKVSLPYITSLVIGMKFMNGEELRKTIHILNLFKYLQHLEILCFYFGLNSEVGYVDWEMVSETAICQNKHLTHVQLRGYSATVGELDFARCLIVRAQSLRSMDISHSVDLTPEDISRQTESICRLGKASPLAQLFFTRSADSGYKRRKEARFLDRVTML
ncbi:putative FBD-associated F-box protein At5g53640 [Hordeum vulgare subsp. vulgare]|uniref:FBD domain-containing protein n=1 Tax=Hordeum vulgare subsp. vulgare TaxID=112509 RepID=A0A8I6YEQ2_HORVV|nr:putative FBD-associated F-box protein At5g53640 [Hordeum vulgare subsp. vulgare]